MSNSAGPIVDDDVEDAPPEEKAGALKEITLLAREQLKLERAIEKLDKQRGEMADALKSIREVKLPNAMTDAGLKDLGLDNGWRVQLEEDVSASIPKDRRLEGCTWCEANEAYDLVKHTLTIDVGRVQSDGPRRPGGGERAVKSILNMMKRLKFSESFKVTESKTVAPPTLSKMVRDRRKEKMALEKAGANFIPPHLILPADLLGIHELRWAKLVPPKRTGTEL